MQVSPICRHYGDDHGDDGEDQKYNEGNRVGVLNFIQKAFKAFARLRVFRHGYSDKRVTAGETQRRAVRASVPRLAAEWSSVTKQN